jgi:hypothetical protein
VELRQELVLELDEALLRQELLQELVLDEEQQQELVLELVLEEQSRRRNRGQPLQASKRHRASTGCRRRFSTAGCRGHCASCRKQH